MPPLLGAQSLNHWTTREVPWLVYAFLLMSLNGLGQIESQQIFGAQSTNIGSHLTLGEYLEIAVDYAPAQGSGKVYGAFTG